MMIRLCPSSCLSVPLSTPDIFSLVFASRELADYVSLLTRNSAASCHLQHYLPETLQMAPSNCERLFLFPPPLSLCPLFLVPKSHPAHTRAIGRGSRMLSNTQVSSFERRNPCETFHGHTRPHRSVVAIDPQPLLQRRRQHGENPRATIELLPALGDLNSRPDQYTVAHTGHTAEGVVFLHPRCRMGNKHLVALVLSPCMRDQL